MVYPARFIPLAEETAPMVPLNSLAGTKDLLGMADNQTAAARAETSKCLGIQNENNECSEC
jgi:hypothetical protein